MTSLSSHPLGVVYEPAQAVQIAAELKARGITAELLPCQSERALAAALGQADFLVATPFSADLFGAAPRATWLQSLSAGVDAWLVPPGPPPWPITRLTGLYEHYMAQYVLAHLLHRSQRLAMLAEAQSRRIWIDRDRWMPIRTQSLRGQLIGVAGLGHVGSEVARVCDALGMRVRGLRRRPDTAQPSALPDTIEMFAPAQLSQFLAGLDVLVLTVPLTPQTAGMIGTRELAMLGRSALVVNMARGAVIDEAALCNALSSGQIAGAVLDTFELEPLPADSPLWWLANVTITPHIAGEASAAEVADACAQNIDSYLRGQIPGVVVDVERGY